MHVGMKKRIPENLRQKNFHPVAGKFFQIKPRLDKSVRLRYRNTRHFFHHNDVGRTVIPENLRYDQLVGIGEIPAQLAVIRRFTHQIQFVMKRFVELMNDGSQPQALSVTPEFFTKRRKQIQQFDVASDPFLHFGTQNLHRNFTPVVQRREMHLRNGSRRDRNAIERGKQLFRRCTQRFRYLSDSQRRIERRHTILQFFQFIGDFRRQQIASGRKHLPELDENRPQLFQCLSQSRSRRHRHAPPEKQTTIQNRQAPSRKIRHGHLVQSIPEENVKNHNQPPDLPHYPVAPNFPFLFTCFLISDIRYVIFRYLAIDRPGKPDCGIHAIKNKTARNTTRTVLQVVQLSAAHHDNCWIPANTQPSFLEIGRVRFHTSSNGSGAAPSASRILPLNFTLAIYS